MNTSGILQPRQKQTAVSLSERYKDVTTIAQAFTLQEAPLAEIKGDVKTSVKIHLSALSRFLNLRATLTEEHIDFIADKLLSDQYYKWLKPADLKIFFERIKMGHYGDFYGNLNSISFFQSLEKYMNERSNVIEQIRINEAKQQRENMRQSPALNYFINKDGRIEYTEEYKARLAAEEKKKSGLASETHRMQTVAVSLNNFTEEESARIKEIMDEWDVPYNEAVKMFKKEQQKTKQDNG